VQGLAIFGLRLLDTTFFTIRLMLTARGQKLLAGILGFFGALIYVIAISPVIKNMSDWGSLIGYSAGFSTGMLIGLYLEERLAVGFTLFRIVSPSRGAEVAQNLRSVGFAVTEIPAWGLQGNVSLLHCFVRRKRMDELVAHVVSVDDEAFISIEEVRSVTHGFWNR
jgi:uncharacterized protein YebE (UPF0316 family)